MQNVIRVQDFFWELPTRTRNVIDTFLSKKGFVNWMLMPIEQFVTIHASEWRIAHGMGRGSMDVLQEALVKRGHSIRGYEQVMSPSKVYSKKFKNSTRQYNRNAPREAVQMRTLEDIILAQRKRIEELEGQLRCMNG